MTGPPSTGLAIHSGHSLSGIWSGTETWTQVLWCLNPHWSLCPKPNVLMDFTKCNPDGVMQISSRCMQMRVKIFIENKDYAHILSAQRCALWIVPSKYSLYKQRIRFQKLCWRRTFYLIMELELAINTWKSIEHKLQPLVPHTEIWFKMNYVFTCKINYTWCLKGITCRTTKLPKRKSLKPRHR